MKILLFLAAAAVAMAQSVLRMDPPVITACDNGVAGQATIFWQAPGAGPVTLFAADTPMTGPEPGTGATRTGSWVTDGMIFTLRDAYGQALATTSAVVKCDAGGWFPLDVGNEWHFRRNDRVSTGNHSVWRVVRKEQVNGVDWAVLSGTPTDLARLRTDPERRLYSLSNSGVERLLLDPAGDPSGLWLVTARSPIAITLAGAFSEELTWRGRVLPLARDVGRLARGVGPTYYQSDVVAGSSGGFGVSYTLLEAVIGGARFVPNYPALELSLETQVVNMEVKSARNCALPCYFVACFGADSPNTYKPCIEANVRGGAGRLTLTDPTGKVLFESPASGWVRIPLYTAPATPLPPGRYTVSATVNSSTVTLPLVLNRNTTLVY
jgi:hypothetical protein